MENKLKITRHLLVFEIAAVSFSQSNRVEAYKDLSNEPGFYSFQYIKRTFLSMRLTREILVAQYELL